MARIKIDATALASFNYDEHLAAYYAELGTATRGSHKFYDAEYTAGPGLGYVSGNQIGVTFAGATNDALIVYNGADMQYDGVDGVHHGSYSGAVDNIHFGYFDENTVIPPGDDANPREAISGMVEGLIVSGLDIDEVPNQGADPANDFWTLFNAVRSGNNAETGADFIDALYDLFGSKGQRFNGSEGDDVYSGTQYADKINGGAGFDTLAGGKGKDVFIFKMGDSAETIDDADLILDFSNKDRINLRSIDANENKGGNQNFKFIGEDDFSGKARELRYERDGDSTHVYMDVDGDGNSDMTITLDGGMKLQANDFAL